MLKLSRNWTPFAVVLVMLFSGAVVAQAEEDRARLPQEHEYQRVLRDYMATLKVEDFEHGVEAEGFEVLETEVDGETAFRRYVNGRTRQPKVGFKRGIPAVNAPAWLFLLETIEGPLTAPSREELVAGHEPQRTSAKLREGPVSVPTGIVRPPVWPDALVSFTQWEYPGNHFRDNKALKMRAFVTAAVRMIMLDDYFGTGAQNRSDWNAYKFVTFAYTFQGVRDLLPEPVREAYRDGLTRFARRLLEWGVHGEEAPFDLTLPLAMWYATQTVNDPQVAREAEALAKRMLSDPEFFHPAGYWVERGGVDIAFQGMANNFAIWTALASDWPEAKEAVAKLYRLRAHLTMPEPDGAMFGPSHFNNRLGSAAHTDQWDWDGMRELGAFMVTDEAAPAMTIPTEEDLAEGIARSVSRHNGQIYGHMRNPYNPFRGPEGNYGYVLDKNLRGSTWSWRLWDTFNYPLTVNYADRYYKPGSYARLQELKQNHPEMFESPYVRGENFLRNFGDAFFAVRQDGYAAIVHTGPVGEQHPDDGFVQYKGPMGFGGGQLSAFWTPQAGFTVLGTRAGMNYDRSYDTLEGWRQWPIHAVTGVTADGKVFSSSRIIEPEVVSDLSQTEGVVTVSGAIPGDQFAMMGQDASLTGQVNYQRRFELAPEQVRVVTTISGDGKDPIAELYETLPVLIQRSARVKDDAQTMKIEFHADGAWVDPTAEPHDQVDAVRFTRFNGQVVLTFDQPQRVKLSPEPWVSPYLPRGVTVRNILVDLLGGDGQPTRLDADRSIAYTIRSVTAE